MSSLVTLCGDLFSEVLTIRSIGRNSIIYLKKFKVKISNYFFWFSKQSFAIRINLDTAMLRDDCPIPKSLKACSLAKSKASFVKVILLCFFSGSFFHFAIKFSSVMMTFNVLAMFNNFFLVIYNICHKSILTIRQSLYKMNDKGLIVKKTIFRHKGFLFFCLKSLISSQNGRRSEIEVRRMVECGFVDEMEGGDLGCIFVY